MSDFVFEKFRQNLALNEKPRVNIAGSFLRLSECVYPVTIRLLGPNGRIVGSMDNVLAGDYVKDFEFSGFIIENTSAAQFISIQIASGGVGTDRVLGEVSVVNGELARVKAGSVFMGQGGVIAVAGQYSHVQLLNPLGSGKNLILNKASIYSGTAHFVAVSVLNGVTLTSLAGASLSKKIDAPGASVAQIRSQTIASVSGTPMGTFGIASAGDSKDFQFSEPIVIPPNCSIAIVSQVVNTSIWGSFQWNEENA